jgi:hypothetical protein
MLLDWERQGIHTCFWKGNIMGKGQMETEKEVRE